MSSNWGTSGGLPVSSNSGQPPPEQDDGPTMAARYGLKRAHVNQSDSGGVRGHAVTANWPHKCDVSAQIELGRGDAVTMSVVEQRHRA